MPSSVGYRYLLWDARRLGSEGANRMTPWTVDADDGGDFISWQEEKREDNGRIEDEMFVIYLPARTGRRKAAIRVILRALNEAPEGTRPSLAPSAETLISHE